ncbi:hypothetical protein N780_08345 [Pontibacillus chungwhensis BH030062]|uniref:Uncharacterized protein n=1 Tax=Pontibacillus chungwhensis BH030062 TaxID=1385513 RepID=A0A0A2UTR9_9BACI|nr:hypothetical protein [Pontibacillus chungwhensis]KGP91309.1 hypothetical protein N780_08345 [Pontibacillus chungwhensis BH030062]
MEKQILFACIVNGIFLNVGTPIYAEDEAPKCEKANDTIEWVAGIKISKTREDQIEHALTLALQGKTFAALERKYIEGRKENGYYMEPFKIIDIRNDEHGFTFIDLLVRLQRVVDNKPDLKREEFLVTFKADYDCGFVVSDTEKLN